MKYYESTCNEYVQATKQLDLHPELDDFSKTMPASLSRLGNIIFYGPSGVGKYTQALKCVDRYSENRLKTEKMTISTEKHAYEYHISDVHYEIDMALLGCESKKLWNDVFFQIADVVSAKKTKAGIILCKNFHAIHGELLDIFYSYIQHCRTLSIHIAFILLTEHVSFIPNRILQCCRIVAIKRPDAKMYKALSAYHSRFFFEHEKITHKEFSKNIGLLAETKRSASQGRLSGFGPKERPNPLSGLSLNPLPDPESILNLKELRSAKNGATFPKDIFNIVCDNIIVEMMRQFTHSVPILDLRDHLYDILLYGIDITDCLWYILAFFVESGHLHDISEIMVKIDSFLKCYNNNYRPIYHLESIFIYLITKLGQ